MSSRAEIIDILTSRLYVLIAKPYRTQPNPEPTNYFIQTTEYTKHRNVERTGPNPKPYLFFRNRRQNCYNSFSKGRVETNTHFYREQEQYFKIRLCIISFCLTQSTLNKFLTLDHQKKVAAVTTALVKLRTIPFAKEILSRPFRQFAQYEIKILAQQIRAMTCRVYVLWKEHKIDRKGYRLWLKTSIL